MIKRIKEFLTCFLCVKDTAKADHADANCETLAVRATSKPLSLPLFRVVRSRKKIEKNSKKTISKCFYHVTSCNPVLLHTNGKKSFVVGL